MALVTVSETKNIDTLLEMAIWRLRALDKRRNLRMTCSNGRRMTGRQRRYYLSDDREIYLKCTAYTDEEARDKFLKRLRNKQGE